MPNWREVLAEIQAVTPQQLVGGLSPFDVVRRKYMQEVHAKNGGRNVIAYYSGWLQRPNTRDVAVNDKDISGFMLNIHGLDKSKGLDLILHTPGGDLAATESLVSYLKKVFDNDIRAIVPHLSMSAGTMIALSCKEIMMGKHSSLGPIDPQIEGMPCEAVIAEFERARKEILTNRNNALLWQYVISKYHPTFLNSCQNAIDMANQLARKWLKDNMCGGDSKKAIKICNHFSSHKKTKIHGRHLPADVCRKIGVNIVDMEADQDIQEAVLTTHHTFMHTFSNTNSLKIIENHNGIRYIEAMPIQMPSQPVRRP